MATSTSKQEKEVVEPEVPEYDVHHVVRGLSNNLLAPARDAGYFPAEEIDAYLRIWLERGYKLAFTTVLDYLSEVGWRMMYLLVKQ